MMKPLLLGYDARSRPIRLSPEERRIHMHVIGSSGSGKSKFLEWMMRGDLNNHQGFALLDPHATLYDAMARYCARYPTLSRNVILLNLSAGDPIIGFNPFRRGDGDVSVQVDSRVAATMHAWGTPDADEKPTLARTLHLIYTVMVEQNLALPQMPHLFNFDASDIRSFLIERAQTPLVKHEWEELQRLKIKDWRQEMIAAKNRLFKLLLLDSVRRFMGVADVSIDLREIMDSGKVLLVNLKRSKYLSHEGAKTFGALLVNQFFEAALDRKPPRPGRDPNPYYLYMDEFQNFVSLDITRMLAEVRKFGLFLIMAHQYFEQLDEQVTAAAMNNCQIKAVFGGLAVANNAERMAKELFIGQLDPYKVMAAIYQTKFWPVEETRQVHTRGTSHGTTSTRSSTTGGGQTTSASSSTAGSTAYFYDDWFSLPELSGTRTETTSRGNASMSGSSSNWAEGSSDSDSYVESESVADIPVFVPVPFQELSSIQFMPPETQLLELTAALKLQLKRHCFIQIQQQKTQPMLVPKVEDVFITPSSLQRWQDKALSTFNALAAGKVDLLIEEQEQKLIAAAAATSHGTIIESQPQQKEPEPVPAEPPPTQTKGRKKETPKNIFDDLLGSG
jgi:TraM recognition site of TraD and TraG